MVVVSVWLIVIVVLKCSVFINGLNPPIIKPSIIASITTSPASILGGVSMNEK